MNRNLIIEIRVRKHRHMCGAPTCYKNPDQVMFIACGCDQNCDTQKVFACDEHTAEATRSMPGIIGIIPFRAIDWDESTLWQGGLA